MVKEMAEDLQPAGSICSIQSLVKASRKERDDSSVKNTHCLTVHGTPHHCFSSRSLALTKRNGTQLALELHLLCKLVQVSSWVSAL